MSRPNEPKLLGPFLGHVTANSIKIWLHFEGSHEVIYVTLHPNAPDTREFTSATLTLRQERLFTDCVTIEGLSPDTKYFYRLWTNQAHSLPLPLQGLTEKDLNFRTLSADPNAQIDFVVMSCHNPTVSQLDGFEGHAVWADLPQIIARESNEKVRFALLVGDQVYADEWQDKILQEETEDGRLRHYLSAYRRFWSNIHYRRVMCSLPAVMIWDDHDITDGWGSEASSFDGDTAEFKPEWKRLFEAAFKAFSIMQGSRNPPTLANNPRDGLDFCFRVGKWGFVLMDLRTNRNLRLHRLLTPDQARRIRKWAEDNKRDMNTLFVVSPVVLSHGSPVVEDLTVAAWPWVMKLVDFISRGSKWGKGLQTKFGKSLGDIRDDIKDSWGSKENAAQTDDLLNFLFGLQNDEDHSVGVIILSGDIHTSGYANIYSSDPDHAGRSSIPHITSSSVSYSPFNWLLEAVYRHASKAVTLGARGVYTSQISHHFCSRSVAVLSLRPAHVQDDYQLKVKYYLEGFPEPQILLFDLSRTSHRENVAWVAQEKLFEKEYSPSANVDINAVLMERAKTKTRSLDWPNSIVDLMKLLNLDSTLGARKKLAQEWGYTGALNGSAEMNIWLHQEMIKRIRESGGNVPEEIGALE
jgi:phosphodiesterase/alkaline phosphatase D-like protein